MNGYLYNIRFKKLNIMDFNFWDGSTLFRVNMESAFEFRYKDPFGEFQYNTMVLWNVFESDISKVH